MNKEKIKQKRGIMYIDALSYGLELNTIIKTKRWIEHKKNQIVTEKSEPTFEEIK